jgi:flagellar assembly protein FliH
MTCSDAVAATARPVSFEALEQLAPPEPPAAPSGDPAAEAAAIVQAAQVEAGMLREQAREEGYAEGVAQGRAETTAHLAPGAQALAGAAAQLAALQAEAADAAEARAASLAIAMAEKIVAGALEVGPERVVDAVRGALRGVLDGDRILVCVHPDDVALVRAALGDAGALAAMEHVEVVEERRVARGGALVRTVDGEIDATVAAKLERLRELVAEELAH